MVRHLKFVCKLLGYWIHKLSRIVPREQSKWVLGSHFGFGDNPKYLFYEIESKHPEIRPIWISHNMNDVRYLRKKGHEVYHWLSLQGLYHTVTAKVQISNVSVEDINRCLSGGAFYVNLWHGVGAKKVRWLAPDLFMRKYHLKSVAEMRTSFRFKVETFPWLFRKPDLCLVPSSKQAECFFAPMMDIPMKNIMLGMYPRNELLLKNERQVSDFIKSNEPHEANVLVESCALYDKVYIYMPTWRNNGINFIEKSGIDWEQLNGVLRERNALFIIRLHPHTRMDLEVINQYDHIVVFPSVCDLYTILPFTDCLITDYSSIYSDYSLMNKEIILFVFDYDDYVKNSYELKDYDIFYPGTRAYDFKELLSIIANNRDCHVKKEEHDFILNTYWDSINSDLDIVSEVKKRSGWNDAV